MFSRTLVETVSTNGEPDNRPVIEQGHLLLHPIERLGIDPHGEVPRENDRLVGARGWWTGAVHVVREDGATLWGPRGEEGTLPILIVERDVKIVVEDEGRLVSESAVPPGWYAAQIRESNGLYSEREVLRPKRHGSPRYIERFGLVCLVGIEQDIVAQSKPVFAPASRHELLALSLGERASLEGPTIQVLEDHDGDRLYVARRGGTLVHERNGRETRVGLPHDAFRVVWRGS